MYHILLHLNSFWGLNSPLERSPKIKYLYCGTCNQTSSSQFCALNGHGHDFDLKLFFRFYYEMGGNGFVILRDPVIYFGTKNTLSRVVIGLIKVTMSIIERS